MRLARAIQHAFTWIQEHQDFILGWSVEEGLSNGKNDRTGLQPSQMPLSSETQADGLGWYGVAPSALGFAASRAVRIQPSKKLIWTSLKVRRPRSTRSGQALRD